MSREIVKRKREKKTRPPIIKVDTYNDTNEEEKKNL